MMTTGNNDTIAQLLRHQDKCWEQSLLAKKTKDKIVFFIGTIFMTALLGSGLLIYQATIADNPDKIEFFQFMYAFQYVLMHFVFVILYLYYKYNGMKEKIFTVDVQCCQIKINKLLNLTISPIDFCFIKSVYIEYKIGSIQVKALKTRANVVLTLAYCMFAGIPLFSKLLKTKLVLFTSSGLLMSYKIGLFVLPIILGSVIYFINQSINKSLQIIKQRMADKWELSSDDRKAIMLDPKV